MLQIKEHSFWFLRLPHAKPSGELSNQRKHVVVTGEMTNIRSEPVWSWAGPKVIFTNVHCGRWYKIAEGY